MLRVIAQMPDGNARQAAPAFHSRIVMAESDMAEQ